MPPPPLPRETWSAQALQAEKDEAFHRGYSTALLESYGKDIAEIKERDKLCQAKREENEGKLFDRVAKLESRAPCLAGAADTGAHEGILDGLSLPKVLKIAMIIISVGCALGAGIGLGCYAARSGRMPAPPAGPVVTP